MDGRTPKDAQRLKVMRDPDGHLAGCLQCCVALDFGASPALSFEDCLPGVAVADVLNPLARTFLADEVQRLMRLGIAAWLEVELREDRVAGHSQSSADADWLVDFELPSHDGRNCRLRVAVAAGTAGHEVVAQALACVTDWCRTLDQRVPGPEVLDILAGTDLREAPRLRCGLARAGRVAAEAN